MFFFLATTPRPLGCRNGFDHLQKECTRKCKEYGFASGFCKPPDGWNGLEHCICNVNVD